MFYDIMTYSNIDRRSITELSSGIDGTVSMIGRRAFLGSIAGYGVISSAGCVEPQGDPWRELRFGHVEHEETADGWRVEYELVQESRTREEDRGFHNVRVHAYGPDRSEVGSKYLGHVIVLRPPGGGLSLSLTCSAAPTMLTYSADESPCDDVDTEIGIARYDDDEGQWMTGYSRRCGEGLSPEPRTDDGDEKR